MKQTLYLPAWSCQYLLGQVLTKLYRACILSVMAKQDLATSELFSELSKLGAAKGGRARANVLTPAERSEIARKAVQARWAKTGTNRATIAGEQVSSDLVEPPKKGVVKNPE